MFSYIHHNSESCTFFILCIDRNVQFLPSFGWILCVLCVWICVKKVLIYIYLIIYYTYCSQ